MRPDREPPDREDGESDEAFEARQKEAQHPSWPRAVPIIGIPGLHKSSIAREETAERIKAGLIDKKVVVMLQRLDFAAEHQAKFAELGIRAGIFCAGAPTRTANTGLQTAMRWKKGKTC